MKGLRLHPEAYNDLDEIWNFIAADSVAAADRVLEEIRGALANISLFPGIGHRRPDLTRGPLRFHAVRSFLIVYAPDQDPLQVIAVLHGRRNPQLIAAMLRERD